MERDIRETCDSIGTKSSFSDSIDLGDRDTFSGIHGKTSSSFDRRSRAASRSFSIGNDSAADDSQNNTDYKAWNMGANDTIWMKTLVNQYEELSLKGIQGDVPPPAAFARDFDFWKAMGFAGVVGALLGLLSLIFLNFADTIPKVWSQLGASVLNDDDFFRCGGCSPQNMAAGSCTCTKYMNCQPYSGSLWWILVLFVTGLTVGLMRFFIGYPDDMPGLFKEIHSYHVDPKWAPWTFLLSLVSLSGGATLGPEQALGNLGGGLATYLVEKWIKFEDKDYNKLFVLSGMAAALGALFPTPILAVLMLHELGNPPKSYMESTLILACSSCTAFLVYYGVISKGYIVPFTSNGAVLSAQWTFQEWNCGTAIIIGVVSAALGIVALLFIGICKQIFNRIRMRLYLKEKKFLAMVLPSCIAGVCIGAINWALPLTIGNGNMVVSSIISYGYYQNELSTNLLICTGFARLFCLALSMSSGFIGGFIFPLITIAIICGVVCNKMYPQVPLGLAVGCFMTSLPASICPMPFTLAALAIFCFYFGLYQTAPIFISTVVSYTIVCGTGLFGALQARGQQQTEQQNEILKQHVEQKQRNTFDSGDSAGVGAGTGNPMVKNIKASLLSVKDAEQREKDLEEALNLSKTIEASQSKSRQLPEDV